jgi:hypothetical protein
MESVSLIDLSNRAFSLDELEAELEVKGGDGARVDLSHTSMRWNDCVKLVKLLEQLDEIRSKHLRFEASSPFLLFLFCFCFFFSLSLFIIVLPLSIFAQPCAQRNRA